MKSVVIPFALLFSLALVGCESKPATINQVKPVDANETKPLEVTAPGVDVKVGPQGGVEVKAPGVEVDTK